MLQDFTTLKKNNENENTSKNYAITNNFLILDNSNPPGCDNRSNVTKAYKISRPHKTYTRKNVFSNFLTIMGYFEFYMTCTN